MTTDDAALVALAADGDQDALAAVVRRLQDPLYRLALRMTGGVPDAEDATQEILIRVITRLASFRGEASLVTWAYRIGVNHLINARRASPRELLTFDGYRQDLLDGLSAPESSPGSVSALASSPAPAPDAELLAEEVRLLCSQALLQCLDRTGRAVYILGEIIRLPGDEAAWILALPPAAYRKRLERARRQLRSALADRCGLLNAEAPCLCGKRVNYAKARGRIAADGPAYVTHRVTESAAAAAAKLHVLRDVGDLLRAHPDYAAPPERTEAVLSLIRSGGYRDLLPDEPAIAEV